MTPVEDGVNLVLLTACNMLVSARPCGGVVMARRPNLWALEHLVLPDLRDGPGPEDDPVVERVCITILWRDGLVETRARW